MATGKTETRKKPTLKELDTVINYMVIKFTYGAVMCLPYAQGAAIIAAMEKAEKVEQSYGQPLKFTSEQIQIEHYALPQKDYREAKMRLLLGVDPEDPIDALE